MSAEKLRKRVIRAVDVLCGMGMLAPAHLNDWRQGRVDHLERVTQGNPWKISDVMRTFGTWVQEQVLRDTVCSECGTGIEQDSLLIKEGEQALCMACARLDELEFLPAGNAALTRRATKFSGKVATVVRFSRSRNRV